jgi:hypothetical protein
VQESAAVELTRSSDGGSSPASDAKAATEAPIDSEITPQASR